MSKESKWFTHKSTANSDPKIMVLIDQLGLEGYGAYWILLETLRSSEDHTFNINNIQSLSIEYNYSIDCFLDIIENYNLFIVDQDKNIHSVSLLEDAELLNNVYLFRIKRKGERFYKIGRSNNPDRRASTIAGRFRYNVDVVHIIPSVSRSNAVALEKQLHWKFQNKKHIPELRFDGYTECFKLTKKDIERISKITHA